MSRRAETLVGIAAALCLAGLGRADTAPISLGSFVNADLTTYTGGSNYPQHGGPLTVDTIPFELSTIGAQSDTAIIQTTGTQEFSIPVGIFGVSTAYLLIDSAFGNCGASVGEIDIIGSSQTYVYTLVEGGNIRDHFNGVFCNVAGDVTATANFGGDRLDMDAIKLPAAFLHQTLESIDFKSSGNAQAGEPFLAAATVFSPFQPEAAKFNLSNLDTSPVPEPSQLLVVGVGVALLFLIRCLKRRAPFVPLGGLLVGMRQREHR